MVKEEPLHWFHHLFLNFGKLNNKMCLLNNPVRDLNTRPAHYSYDGNMPQLHNLLSSSEQGKGHSCKAYEGVLLFQLLEYFF